MKRISVFFCIVALLFSLASCGYMGAQSQKLDAHRWGRFQADDIEHWRTCMDEGCGAVDRKAHTTHEQMLVCMKIPNCDVCGEKYGAPTPHRYDENGSCIRCEEKEHGEGLEYFHADSHYVVEGVGHCNLPDVEISSVHNGLPVTEISAHAFAEDHLLESIVIPDTITKIGWAAFSGCDHLRSVALPHGIKDIEGYLFNGCAELAFVEIPDGVEHIGDHAFYHCHALMSVDLPVTMKNIDGTPFGDCDLLESIVYHGTVEQWSEIKKGKASIPKNVTVHCTNGDWIQD